MAGAPALTPVSVSLTVNDAVRHVDAKPETPLLYILRNDLALNGPKYGCGLGECGACAVLVDNRPVRSCTVPLGAVGTHCLDLARWYLRPGCGEIERAHALTSSPVHHSPHDETALVALRFASGATADILCSVLIRAGRSIELYGEAGTARAEDVLGPHGGGRIVINDQELAYTPVDPYRGELQDFVDAVAHGRAPEVDGDEGLANVRWLCDVTSR